MILVVWLSVQSYHIGLEISMLGIYQSFSLRQLSVGALLFLIGVMCSAQLFFLELSHKIYITPLVAGPIFLLAGVWIILQSFFTSFCNRCRIELIEKCALVNATSEYNFDQFIRNHQISTLKDIEIVSKTVLPRLDITMRYCPACVQIAMVKANRHENKIANFIPWTIIEGHIVRALKEKLVF
mgnify:CR=1 FL=1